jgi:hypothetical protein
VTNNENLPDHARLAPSSAKRWLKCPGSAQWDLPNSSNPASIAGDIGHDLADAYLKSDDPLKDLLFLEDDVYEQVCHHVDEDKAAGIARAVSVYVETVEKYSEGALSCKYEEKVVHKWIEDFFGTIDCSVYTPGAEYELTIVDLKTGTYKVPAKSNPQLKAYACLARQGLDLEDPVRVVICQDRVYAKPQVAYFTQDELDKFELEVDVAGRSDLLVPGNDQCFFCPLRFTCEARAEKFGEIV